MDEFVYLIPCIKKRQHIYPCGELKHALHLFILYIAYPPSDGSDWNGQMGSRRIAMSQKGRDSAVVVRSASDQEV